MKTFEKNSVINGRYKIHDVINSGGMGIIYYAFDQEWEIPVAIKTFIENCFFSYSIRVKFIQEAETWIRLEKNKNIVTAYYVKEIEQQPCIFLELIHGHNEYGTELTGWIQKQQLTIKTILDFAIQICNGMIYANHKLSDYGKPFVHRDIKPSNILVTSDRVIKITDFGLVNIFQKEDLRELNGIFPSAHFLGTPEYMSPEQFEDYGDIGIESDIYSFGCLLYEMLCGCRPFQAPKDIASTLLPDFYYECHLKQMPTSPVKKRVDCPIALNNIVLKCMEKDSKGRFRDFNQVKHELVTIYNEFFGEYLEEINNYHLNAWEKNNQGLSFICIRRFDSAINYFNEALSLNPRMPEALFNKGNAFYEMEEFIKALECYEEALAIKPLDEEIWVNKGNTLSALGKIEDSIQCYKQALLIKPGYKEALNNLGSAFMELNQDDEALSYFESIIEMDPHFPEAWYHKGYINQKRGLLKEAVSCYNEAINIRPNYADALMNKGKMLMELGEVIEAFKIFINITDLDPRNFQASNNLSAYLIEQNKLDDAMYYLDIALLNKPNEKIILYNKGKNLYLCGQLEEAIDFYNKALLIDPNLYVARFNMGNIFLDMDKNIEAVKCYDLVLISDPCFVKAWNNKGVALFKLNRLEEANQCFDNALKLKPSHFEAWNNKGLVMSHMDNLDEAVYCYNEALSIYPNYYSCFFNKGKALCGLGKTEEAIQSFEEFIRLTPSGNEDIISEVKKFIHQLRLSLEE